MKWSDKKQEVIPYSLLGLPQTYSNFVIQTASAKNIRRYNAVLK